MERVLVPDRLPHLLRAVHAALVEHRDEVDALNVFPVPDGDTGTNLAATAEAVVAALSEGGDQPAPRELTRIALRSARGNSGVIFSQVVRSVVEAVADPATANGHEDGLADVAVLAAALSKADERSREAVAAPVEGTILTAITTAAQVVAAARDAGRDDFVGVLDEVGRAVSAAVQATRDQLEVLRDAGVVDAGARGFEVVMAALTSVATGEPVRTPALDNLVPRCLDAANGVDGHPIEVQFLVEGGDDVAARLRSSLGEVGDSVVVVAADGLVHAHVHTSQPDAVLAAGREVGEPVEVRTTDLRNPAEDESAGPVPTLAVVAVLPPGGLQDLAAGSGACLVDGSAGELPSVHDLLEAVRRVDAGEVTLLPGHPNVVPTARQAAVLSRDEGGATVHVVGSAVHPLVVLSCLTLQSDDPVDLEELAAHARSGAVVAAVRDADLPIGAVRRGQPLVVAGGDVVAVAQDEAQALTTLLSHLDAPSSELVTVAIGADATTGPAEVMMAAVEGAGDAEVDVIDGGQRPDLLLVVVEG